MPGGDVLADQSFRRFWAARTVSLTGSAITGVLLPLLMYQKTGSALATSLLAGSKAVPYIVFGPLAGVASDRIPRRRYLVAFDLGQRGGDRSGPGGRSSRRPGWAAPLRGWPRGRDLFRVLRRRSLRCRPRPGRPRRPPPGQPAAAGNLHRSLPSRPGAGNPDGHRHRGCSDLRPRRGQLRRFRRVHRHDPSAPPESPPG
ncbi:MAG: hypothetical protein HKL89_02180, partial [Candidatus Dormibacteraeota bacterium]|nr:hypothetical protein [Candidatus Dormibacteraeota bacterium]